MNRPVLTASFLLAAASPGLLAKLPPTSFVPGLVPPDDLPAFSLTLFLTEFLRLFSDPTADEPPVEHESGRGRR